MIYDLELQVKTLLTTRINDRIAALQSRLESVNLDYDTTQVVRGQLKELRAILTAKAPSPITTENNQ